MKKIISFVLVFLILFSGLIVYAHSELLSVKDKVEIEETVIYGEKEAAKGIKAQLNANYQNLLLWKTDYSIENENINTKYEFSKYAKSDPIRYNYGGVSLNLSFQFSYREANENSTGITKAYYDSMQSLPEGGEATVKVKLIDYYDYYPMDINIDTPTGAYFMHSEQYVDRSIEKEIAEAFTDYFKIPVSPEDYYEFEISKKSNAMGVSTMATQSQYSGYTLSAIADDACYFLFADMDEKVDMSEVKGGFGIYKLPLNNNEYGIDYENISTVYSLPRNEQYQFFALSEDKKDLLLFSSDKDTFYLNVIDEETYRLRQRIALSKRDENSYYEFLYNKQEDFLVFGMNNYKLIVLTQNEKRDYEIALTSLMDERKAEVYNIGWRTAMDFDGKRLVIMDNMSEGRGSYDHYNGRYSCDFYVAIFDETGIAFKGEYVVSLSKGENSVYKQMCRVSDDKPYIIEIEKSLQ